MKRSIITMIAFLCFAIGAQAQYDDYYSIINGTKYRPGVKKMVEKGAYVDAYYMLQIIKSEGYSMPNPPTDYNKYLKLTTEKVTDQVVEDLIPYDKDTKPIVEMAASMGYKPAKDYLNPSGYNIGGGSTSSRETFTVKGVSFTMIRVEGNGDPYYIGETEVTQGLWQAVMGNTISDQRDKANTSWNLGAVGQNYPMYYVNYDDCEQFVRRLSSLTGINFRMPSADEWKYAAKGGRYTHNYEHSGSNTVEEVGWVSTNGNSTQHVVKMKKANELGFYDMSGNVCEWTTSMQNSYRIALGGSYYSSMKIQSLSHNYTFNSTDRYANLGFRLAFSDDNGIFTVNGVSFKMIKVEGNGNPYYIGETEVTQGLWQAVMGNTISDQRDKANTSWSLGAVGSDYPMYFVNYDDCEQFVRRLNSLTGRNFRVPSESEWKYAAKGGSYTHNYEHSGSNNVEEVGWVSTNGNNTQHLVKMKKANELGIYDMSGNVCEWTNSMQNSYRIGLGGSFSSKMVINPITHNYTFESTGRYSNLGFRLAL